jgi:hypothetical protein
MPEMWRDWIQTVISRSDAKREERSMDYKEYLITEIVNDKGQWQAHIRRRDGKQMSVEGATLPVFTTMHADSENEAIRIAKEAIDTRKISAAKS